MGSKKAKASAVSGAHDDTTKPGIGAGIDTPGTKHLSEKEKALKRVEWLKTLAGQLLQEASELEAKWGSANGGDAMSLDDPADTVDVTTGVTDAASDGPANILKKKKAKKSKKNKKNKKNKAADTETDTMNAEATQPKTPLAPGQAADGQDAETPGVVKSKKDKKRKRQDPNDDIPADAGNATAPVESSSLVQDAGPGGSQGEKDSKKAKKEAKKMKKAAKGKDNKTTKDTGAASASSNNNGPGTINAADTWNISDLGGGAERQNKFMKLLGGGKAASSPANQNSGKVRPRYDVQKSQDDLQKQYDAGMRMKFEGQGQRRGLGA